MASKQESITKSKSTSDQLTGKHYYALLISIFALLFIGIVMILSASTTVSYKQFDNQYVIFLRQLMFAAIGVIIMRSSSSVYPKARCLLSTDECG